MAWSAQLVSATILDGDALLKVVFKEDVTNTSFEEVYRFRSVQSNAFLRDKVRDRIKELNAVSAWVPTLPVGAVVPSADPTPAPGPTQAEVDQAAWITKYRQLQAWMRAVDVGLESSNNAQFIALRDDVIATRLAAYRNFY